MNKLTYLDESLKNGIIVRWASSNMPLKVYIAPCRWYKSQGGDNYTYQKMAKQAFEDWHRASGGLVSFQYVNSLYDSQINLEWKRVERKSLGHCYFSYDSKKRLFSAEVEIGLSDGLVHSEYQNKNEVYHTILHEVGHSLGLGHSPLKNDIMYVPHQYGVETLSQCDKNTIKWLYKLPPTLTPQKASKKFTADIFDSLDEMVMHIEKQKNDTTITEELVEIVDSNSFRDLAEEQEIIADMNLYNLTLQNINIDPELKNYIKKTQIQKDD